MSDLFTYPTGPGFKEGETSREAAEAISATAPLLRERCLDCLSLGPKTPDEVAERLGLSILSVRPRISELARMGRIRDTGQRRRNRSGKRAKVWQIKENAA